MKKNNDHSTGNNTEPASTLLTDNLQTYLQTLASDSHVPGGGAAAALTVAQGLALAAMACELTIGRKKFATVQEQVSRLRDHFNADRQLALEGMEADMQAFDAVMAAYRLASGSEADNAVRQQAIAQACKQAAIPPLQLAQLAVDSLARVTELQPIVNPNLISDVKIASHLLLAGYRSSRENILVNLTHLPSGDADVVKFRARLESLDQRIEAE